MALDIYTIAIHKQRKVATLCGIEMPEATVVKRTANSIVLKVPGHKYWSGRGWQSYAKAEYQVYTISTTERSEIGDTDEWEHIKAYPIVQFDAREGK